MSWHQTPLAARLISDMHRLSAMADAYVSIARAGDGAYHADGTADLIGSLERQGSLFRLASSELGSWKGSGLIGEMLDRLRDERDAWIEARHLQLLRQGGVAMDSDDGDDLYQSVSADADTVTFAIDVWVHGQRRMAA